MCIRDSSEGVYYASVASEDVAWESFGFNVIDNVNVFPDCNGTLGGDVWNDDNDCACNDVDQCPGEDDCLDSEGDSISDCLDSCPFDAENDIDNDGLCCSESVNEVVYCIGVSGPAGGVIFYDKGYESDGWRYLEAAPDNCDNGIAPTTTWGCSGTAIDGADG